MPHRGGLRQRGGGQVGPLRADLLQHGSLHPLACGRGGRGSGRQTAPRLLHPLAGRDPDHRRSRDPLRLLSQRGRNALPSAPALRRARHDRAGAGCEEPATLPADRPPVGRIRAPHRLRSQHDGHGPGPGHRGLRRRARGAAGRPGPPHRGAGAAWRRRAAGPARQGAAPQAHGQLFRANRGHPGPPLPAPGRRPDPGEGPRHPAADRGAGGAAVRGGTLRQRNGRSGRPPGLVASEGRQPPARRGGDGALRGHRPTESCARPSRCTNTPRSS